MLLYGYGEEERRRGDCSFTDYDLFILNRSGITCR